MDDRVTVFYQHKVKAIGEIVRDDRKRARVQAASDVAGKLARPVDGCHGAFYDRHGNLWKLINGRCWVCQRRS
jgi:hypothetical protein